MRSISLCMIARDEEQLLPGCIRSVAELVDEIVVVDTGSRDRTVEIARSFGARVEQRPWDDDFSAARNAALAMARCDFVLILDADERLASGSSAVVRRLIAEDRPERFTIHLPLILNYDQRGRSLGGGFTARLWRRRPELFFTGRIHERVGAGVPDLLLLHERAFRIVHIGYDPELSDSRRKRTRNRTLLQRELAERPSDPALRYHLAQELYAAGDFDGALEKFLEIIEEGRIANYVMSSYVCATECLRILGDPEGAIELGLSGLDRADDYGELWYALGRAALSAERPSDAEIYFLRAEREPTGIAAAAFHDPDVRTWRAEAGRRRARALIEKPEEQRRTE